MKCDCNYHDGWALECLRVVFTRALWAEDHTLVMQYNRKGQGEEHDLDKDDIDVPREHKYFVGFCLCVSEIVLFNSATKMRAFYERRFLISFSFSSDVQIILCIDRP